MHSRIFVINEAEITEEELYNSINICDYVVEETEEERKESIEWLRTSYLGHSSQNDFFCEDDVRSLAERIKENIKARLSKIQDNIAEIKDGNGKGDLGFKLWEIKNLAYPEIDFFFVTDDGWVGNEVEFLAFLKKTKEFKITKTFDYHY